jgi:uncharacterized membrane protein
MTVKRTLVVLVILVLFGLGFSLWAYPQLPEMAPSHWNFAGEVDDTMPRGSVAFLMPGVILALGLLLLFIPNIDPLRANVEGFRVVYNWFILGTSAFFLFLHILVILTGLGVRFNMTHMLIPAASLGMFGIGIVLDRTKPNWFLGVRTPWTLSSPVVWDKTHRLGSRLFKLSGVVILASVFLSAEATFAILIGSILIATVVLVTYSYVAFRAEQVK